MGDLVPTKKTASALVLAAAHRSFKPWLDNYPSAHTQEAYARDALLWDRWCQANGVDLLHPLAAHITLWSGHRREEGDSEATIVRRISSVLTFYKWARHEKITDANPEPFRRPKLNRDEGDVLGLTREQYMAVCENARGARNLALVTLLGRCGLRVSEALNADITDMREQSGHRVIRVVGKGSRPRTVPIPPGAWHLVAQYVGDRAEGPIFVTRSGRRWQRQDVYKTVAAIGDRAGFTLTPHMLRHTAATLMLEAGAPLDRVQLVLGHSSPEVTMRYAKARDRLEGSPTYDLDRYLAG